jgi:xanthine dehydrogenase YagR molybdenum-binding subunit
MNDSVIGGTSNRVDGRLKVTGKAKYTAENKLANLLHAVVLSSSVPAGTIKSIDTTVADKLPGVVKIYTHLNRPKMGTPPNSMMMGGMLGESILPLAGPEIRYFGQCIAFVVAKTLEQAQYAAQCIEVAYATTKPVVLIEGAEKSRYQPVQSNGEPLQIKRGHPQRVLRKAEVTLEQTYETPGEHPNAMEPHASVAHWHDGEITVYETTQWAQCARATVAGTLNISPEKVRILAPFIGGMFGSKANGTTHLMLAALSSRDLDQPVKVVLTRQQVMTCIGSRSRTIQRFELGANRDGKLVAMRHHTTNQTSIHDEFAEACGLTSRLLYDVPNYDNVHELVRTNIYTPSWMRAPGEAPCQFAQEVAMDELAEKLDLDPIELRRLNHTENNPHAGLPWSSKNLLECYSRGEELFGWSKFDRQPHSNRDGRILVGRGMATATYPAMTMGATVRVQLFAEGGRARAVVATAGVDVGTGMYTMMAVTASHELGIPMDDVTPLLGDTNLPPCALAGGSNLTSSVAPAISQACAKIRAALLKAAPALKGLRFDEVAFEQSQMRKVSDPSTCVSYAEALGSEKFEELGQTDAIMGPNNGLCHQSFGAQFAEVRVDPILRTVRVARMTGVYDCGKILNLQAAESQLYGGMTFGIGMALLEEMSYDPQAGRAMNTDLAGYVVPVNADVPDLQVEFVGKPDFAFNPLGCRGIGEIGNTGAAAAIANAVYHATGKRLRKLPILTADLL